MLTGTVAASIADIDFVKRRERVEEFFEDGSASFMSIAAIRHAFKLLKYLTPSAIWMWVKLVLCAKSLVLIWL